jgi:hypothetical protein
VMFTPVARPRDRIAVKSNPTIAPGTIRSWLTQRRIRSQTCRASSVSRTDVRPGQSGQGDAQA